MALLAALSFSCHIVAMPVVLCALRSLFFCFRIVGFCPVMSFHSHPTFSPLPSHGMGAKGDIGGVMNG